jgi:hypothetical protein
LSVRDGSTTLEKSLRGRDVVSGAASLISAMGAGKAAKIHEFITGDGLAVIAI